MLLFGHMGITLGSSLVLTRTFCKQTPLFSKITKSAMDYRLVLLGSMLPDVIDKPIGHLFLSGTFQNGRIFAHTLVFFLVLLAIGLYRLFRSGGLDFLVVALCSGGHLVLDAMWRTPQTLFCPLHGWSFPKSPNMDLRNWLQELYEGLQINTATYIPEIIGAMIFVVIGLELVRSGRLIRFLKTGEFRW